MGEKLEEASDEQELTSRCMILTRFWPSFIIIIIIDCLVFLEVEYLFGLWVLG